MYSGCPVITTRYTSLPEVCGDAVLYVDPDDIDEIAEKINLLAADKILRNELSIKGKAQAAKFSWENTGKIFLDTLNSL
jgi:alpha-1,3-rhamnosyl/mannosyltransferase